jgi:hypothetical protein
MKDVGELLPLHGIELTWVCDQSLVPKILGSPNIQLRVGKHQCLQILLRTVDTTDIRIRSCVARQWLQILL